MRQPRIALAAVLALVSSPTACRADPRTFSDSRRARVSQRQLRLTMCFLISFSVSGCTRQQKVTTQPQLTPVEIIGQSESQSVDATTDLGDSVLWWQGVRNLVGIISSATPWTGSGPDSAQQWRPTIHAALALQQAGPAEVERALLAYMVYVDKSQGAELFGAAWSKPLLILRVMFELPEEEMSAEAEIDLWLNGVAPNGGFPFIGSTPGFPTHISLGSPVAWGPEGPELTARPDRKTILFVGSGYQPQREYRYFIKRFPFRKGLEELAAAPVDAPAVEQLRPTDRQR